MRKCLSKLDLNNMLKNKTAIECWNILKYEIESIIENVSLEKQGKRFRKKHLSKETIRTIVFKQTMRRVYRKDEDYANYKEAALNAVTTEIRQPKRSYEQELACNIKKLQQEFLCICQE